jgi:mannose/fructose/N-acetylgalactosamine-specific phosphotransferase system component IIC
VSPAQSVVAAMITPALLILGSASLIATVLVRLARVVDRSRVLVAAIESGAAGDRAALREALDRHERRAIYAERSVALFFTAVVVFVADCLSLGLDRFANDTLSWLPISLTIAGMLVVIAGAAYMVAESRLGARQILAEIRAGRSRLDAGPGSAGR